MKILITGATGRVGKAIVKRNDVEAYKLALHGRNEKKLQALAATVTKSETLSVASDFTNHEAPDYLMQEVLEKFNGLDVLINNAACFNFSNFFNAHVDDLRNTINVNLTATLIITKLALPHLIKSKQGMIINIASTAGKNYLPGAAAYCASKHGMMGLFGSLYDELKMHGIKICTIFPGQLTIENESDANTIPPAELAELVTSLMHYPGEKSFPKEIVLCA